MRTSVLVAVALASVFLGIGTGDANESIRSETHRYTLSTAPPGCGSAWPTQAWVCFDVRPGEVNFTLQAHEHGPLAFAGPIQGQLTFVGSNAFEFEFCDYVGGRLPQGTTRLVLALDLGSLGFCMDGGTQTSPVFQGEVDATFGP